MNKKLTEREIGFIQGVAYSATLMKQHNFDAYDLIIQSGIKPNKIRKYAEKSDLVYIEEILKAIEK